MKLGVFGGTFNPPHLGHLVVAEAAREALGLGKVLFVPSAVSPHKVHMDIVEAHHRLAMLELATQGNRAFEVSDIEIQRGGLSFTADTLEELHRRYPQDALVLLIGADNLLDFHTWREPEKILSLSEVVALTRPGFTARPVDDRFLGQFSVCAVPDIGIESRRIRKSIKEGKSIRYLVPAAIEVYIQRNDLYA